MSTWVQTYTGRAVDLLNPDPREISLEDICHHLSQINRYSGATPVPYSVAEHSILVHRILCHPAIEAPVEIQLEGLLHDAAEAYIGDITTPVKHAQVGILGPVEDKLNRAILSYLGRPVPPSTLPFVWDPMVYMADQQALSLEYYKWFAEERPRDWGSAVVPRRDLIRCPVPEFKCKALAGIELKNLIQVTLDKIRRGGK